MWTDAPVTMPAAVALIAKHLIVGREIFTNNFAIQRIAGRMSHILSFDVSIVIHMVNRKKRGTPLTATGADATITRVDLIP